MCPIQGVYVWHFTWLLKCFCLPDLIKAKSQSGQSGCLADSIWWRSGCWCWWSVSERQCRDCGGGVYLCRPPKPVRVEKGIQEGYAGYTERYTGWRRQNKQPMKGSFCFRNRTQQSHRRLWDLRSTLLIFKDEKQAQIRVGFLEEEEKTESKEIKHCISNLGIWIGWNNYIKCYIAHNRW